MHGGRDGPPRQALLARSIPCARRSWRALSLIEAGLDFSDGDVAGIAPGEMIQRLRSIKDPLEGCWSEAIQADSVVHLPSVGIAGAPNAGKSTLFNALLGSPRSLVSGHRKTTRDVLEAVLDLQHGRCVVFDCAGLLLQAEDVLDHLAQQAALQSLGRSDLVLFCVDLAKADWQEDLAIRRQVTAGASIGVATKVDRVDPADRPARLDALARALGRPSCPSRLRQAWALRPFGTGSDRGSCPALCDRAYRTQARSIPWSRPISVRPVQRR